MPPPQRARSTGEHKSGFRWSEAVRWSGPWWRWADTRCWHGRTESRMESFWARGSTVRVEDRTDMACTNCHLDYLVMSKLTLHMCTRVSLHVQWYDDRAISRWPSLANWVGFTLPLLAQIDLSCVDVPLNTKQTKNKSFYIFVDISNRHFWYLCCLCPKVFNCFLVL